MSTVYCRAACRGGFALVAVLLILLILGLMAAGMVLISAEQLWISRGMEDLLRARLAAESALRAELLHWRTDEYADMPAGTVREGVVREGTIREVVVREGMAAPVAPRAASVVTTSADVERLSGPRFLIQARAVTPGRAEASAAAVVRGVDPAELWSAFPAALTTAGAVEIMGEAAVLGFSGEPASDSEEPECLAAATATMESIFGSAERPAILHPTVDQVAELSLGPLDGPTLRRVADRIAAGPTAPHPVANPEGCDQGAPANWGAPLEPASPCADYFPLIHAPEGLQLIGGQGQGILVVDGDLGMSGDAEFHGAVAVTGRLRLEGRARIVGAVVVFGDADRTTLDDGSSLAYGPCALQSALSRTTASRRAYNSGDRNWIPGF